MEILLDDNQTLLKASAERFVEQHGGGQRARAARGAVAGRSGASPDAAAGFDRERLAAAAEAGWLTLLVPESAGGAGLGCTELAIVLEQIGSGLIAEPVGALAAVARTLATSRSAASERWLAPVMAGRSILLPALCRETDTGSPARSVIQSAIEAVPDGQGWCLTGTRSDVLCAGAADAFLVDGRAGAGRILAVVAKDAAGLTQTPAVLVDGSHRTNLRLGGVQVGPADIVAGPDRGADLAACTIDCMLIGVAAEMLGVMGRAHAITVEYLKIRQQFARPIGSFQALQHRAVDNHVEVEIVRSLLFQVAAAVDAGRDSRAHVAALKSRASEAVLAVTKSAIQLHGAIGFTDEHDIGLYLRRAMVLSSMHGTVAAERSRYAALAASG